MATALGMMPVLAAHRLGRFAFEMLFSSAHSFALVPLSPTNIFDPAGTPATAIFHLSWLVLGICSGIFVVVAGMLVFVIAKYRTRPSDDETEPTQIYGSNQIELSWTVIPVLLVFILFLTTARVILGTEHIVKPTNALDVQVIGHQFWWEYRYPSAGVVIANELHIPASDANQQRPVYLHMTSADVAHNYSVPRLAGRMDIIPNRVNTTWLDAQQPGLYLGQCAQYCGTQHAKMLLRVYADTPENFATWLKHQAEPAVDASTMTPEQQRGKIVFETNACANCHTVKGTPAQGKFGPDLTHVASRDTLASGAISNNEHNLHQWIDEPDSFKPGALMPPMHLNAQDLNAVTAYMTALR